MVLKPDFASDWSQGTKGWVRSFRHPGFGSGENLKKASVSAVAAYASRLRASLYSRLSSIRQKEFDSLAAEKDPEMFLEGLLAFGQRLEDSGKVELAAEVYGALVDVGAEAPPYSGPVARGFSPVGFNPRGLNPEGFSSAADISPRAQQRLDALMGRGHSGLRFEFLLKRFTETATDYHTIVPMIAGTMAFQMTRVAALGRLATAPRLGWASRGWGLRLTSGAMALGVESTVFLGAHRGLAALTGEGAAHTGSLGRDWLGTTLTLGVLKLAGNAGRALRLPPGIKGLTPALQGATGFGGLMLAHRLEVAAGLRPPVDGATTLTDTFATWLSLGVGANLGHRFLGPGFSRFQQELNIRSGEILSNPPRNSIFNKPRKIWAWAPAGNSLAAQIPSGEKLSSQPGISLMEAKGPGGGSGSYSAEIQNRLDKISPGVKEFLQEKLREQWEVWKPREGLSSELRGRVEQLLAHYAEIALAHFGSQLPQTLPFVAEIYQETFRRLADSLPDLNGQERSVLLRFLSTQPARRMTGEEKTRTAVSPLSPSPLSFEDSRRLLGEIYSHYETNLRREVDRLSTSLLHKAQVYQRGLALIHLYISYLHAKRGETSFKQLEKIPWDQEIWERTLRDSADHPYPDAALEIFRAFMEAPVTAGSTPFPAAGPSLDLPSLDIELPPFQSPLPNETWPNFLGRLKLAKGRLTAADLGVTGATILNWGEKKDPEGRALPPGDILNLLSLVTYIHATHDRGVDPLVAARLVLPEQLADFLPDPNGNIVIRYPDLMRDLDYGHFNLSALLTAFLRGTPEASDLDLADRWKVNPNTVGDYRRGAYHKMHLDTLYRLAESLVVDPADAMALKERVKFLMFLRYRSYFDATMEVLDRDGQSLQPQPLGGSQYRIVLVPDGETLPPLDLTRRIPFEREPFASALNGTVDLALDLLEGRVKEFEILGKEGLSGSAGEFKTTGLRRQIQEFRDVHAKYFQLLGAQVRSPSVIRPGQLREIQGFYRELFRFFEGTYLYDRPRGTLELGVGKVDFEIVPPTWDHPRGLRLERDPFDPTRFRAWVVAADLLAHGSDLSPTEMRTVLGLRLLQGWLEAENLWLGKSDAKVENRKLLLEAMVLAGWERPSDALFLRFELLEWQADQWRGTIADPEAEASLHRILRGSLSMAARQRRTLRWREGLQDWARRHRVSSLSPILEEVFAAYLVGVEEPFLQFHQNALEDALAPVRHREGREVAELAQHHLLRFMKQWGLATEPIVGEPGRLTLEGFVNAAFATYLSRFRALHPIPGFTLIVADPALMRQVLEDRLVDFPHFNPHLERAVVRLEELIGEYNRRNPLLKIVGLAVPEEAAREPIPIGPLVGLLAGEWGRYQEAHPEAGADLETRWILSALPLFKDKLLGDELPLSSELGEAFRQAEQRLLSLGWVNQGPPREVQLRFFGEFVEYLRRLHSRLNGLAAEIPGFVKSGGFHSGLTEAEHLAWDVEQAFRLHTASALTEDQPRNLNEIFLEIFGDRFSPYPMLREDVLRGMRTIYHERLQAWRREYSQYLQAFDLSREEAMQHGNPDQFWGELLALSSVAGRDWDAQGPWLERLEQLEALWALTGEFSGRRLSREAQGIEEEIRAHRPSEPGENPGLRLFLDTPMDLADWKEFPEWAWVEGEALAEEALLWAREAPHLLHGELRPLLQMLAFFRGPRMPRTAELRQAAEDIRLEAFTGGSDAAREILEIAIQSYRKIRPDLIRQLEVRDQLQLWPEFPPPEKGLSDYEADKIILEILISRRLAPELEAGWLKIVDILKAPFSRKLAEFYIKNREAILSHQEIKIPLEYLLPLGDGVPGSYRRKIEQEFPEWDWISDRQIQEELKSVPNGKELMAQQYLYLKIEGFLSSIFEGSPPKKNNVLKGKWEDLRGSYRLLSIALGHVPILYRWLEEKMETFYRSHRKGILDLVAENLGMGPLLQEFPEFRDMQITPHYIGPKELELGFTPPENIEIWWKVLARLRRAMGDPSLNKELEEILWRFPPSTNNSRYKSQVIEWFGEICRYYLKYRNALGVLPDIPQMEDKEVDQEIPFEELNIWSEEELLDQQAEIMERAQAQRRDSPDTWLGLAFLGILPLPVFRWTKGLMELGVNKVGGPAALKKAQANFYEDLDRVTGWLGSGVDFDWVLSLWKKRLQASYEKIRPTLMSMDSRIQVSQFPEIRDVPPEELGEYKDLVQAKDSEITGDHLKDRNTELAIRIRLLLQRPEIPSHFMRTFTELVRKNPDDTVQAALAVSRFYLSHREEILRHFKGWPDPVEVVRGLPEIQAFPYHVFQEEMKGLQHKGFSPEDMEKWEIFSRISMTIFGNKKTIPPSISEAFKRLHHNHGNRPIRELLNVSARFYLEHRSEILPFLTPWEESDQKK